MYVLVDLEKMRFISTGDYRALAVQGAEELGDSAYMIGPADSLRTFSDLTEAEMRLLCANALEGIPPVPGAVVPAKWELPKVCCALAQRAPACRRRVPAVAAQAPEPIETTAPSAPSRPKAGSATGKVWDIADMLVLSKKEQLPATWEDKALKAEVVRLAELEGINGSTAQVQFGKWKKHQ